MGEGVVLAELAARVSLGRQPVDELPVQRDTDTASLGFEELHRQPMNRGLVSLG
jgi:hypothetical protein